MRPFVFALALPAFAVCQQLPPLESGPPAELSPDVLAAPPPEIPFGEAGGVCGVDLVNCTTEKEARKVFSTLPKTLSDSVCQQVATAASPQDRAYFNAVFPRLVNDHKQGWDVLRYTSSVFPAYDYGANYFTSRLTIDRNGGTVVEFVSIYRLLDGEPEFLDRYVNVEIDRGGAEALTATLADRTVVDAIKTVRRPCLDQMTEEVHGFGKSNCDRAADAWCATCKAARYGSLGAGAIAIAAFGVTGRQKARSIAAAISAWAALWGTFADDFLDCDSDCSRGKCMRWYCQCLMIKGRDVGTDKECGDELENCCMTVEASRCARNHNGCYFCAG